MIYLPFFRRKKNLAALIGCAASLILAIILLVLVSNASKRDKQEQDRLSLINEELRGTFGDGEELDVSEEEKKKLESYDLYQKLSEGLQVNALFLGNGAMTSEGSNSRGWAHDAVAVWKERYGVTVQGGNYSRVSTGPFYGYTMMNQYHRGFKYDIIVVCYGTDEDPSDFALFYDGLLRSIKNQNSKCEIYCVIEASESGYNENADTVRRLCNFYGGVCLDMVKYFEENEINYAASLNGIIPTNAGGKVYLEAFTERIDADLKDRRRVPESTAAYDAKAERFDKFTFVESKDLTGPTATSYEYVTEDSVAGIMFYNASSGGDIRIYVNGVEVKRLDNRLEMGSARRVGMELIGYELSGRTVIRIEAGSEENLTNIAGIATCRKK